MLSDPKIIELLNREYNVIDLNVTDDGFPAWLSAIAPWKEIYDASPEAQAAFANVTITDADGTELLNHGDNGKIRPPSQGISRNYDVPRYLEMLELGLARNARLEAARHDTTLTEEARATAIASLRFEVQQNLEKVFAPERALIRKMHPQALKPGPHEAPQTPGDRGSH